MSSNYNFEDQIGKGAFGEVYKAYSYQDKEYVAIKKISLTKNHGLSRAKIEQEVSLSEKLDHPNLVRSITHYEENGSMFLVMELCHGGSLRNLLHKRSSPPHGGGRLREREAGEVLSQLVAGAMELHRHNIIHRDLSTANVFITDEPSPSGQPKSPLRIKIGDFGLSTVVTHPSQLPHTFVGNPPFIAPEVISGQRYGAKADVWSIGSILYHCLTGHTPYTDTREGLTRTTQGIRNPDGENVLKTCSPDAQDLVNRLLQAKEANRISLGDILKHSFCQKNHFQERPSRFNNNINYPVPKSQASADSGLESDRGSNFTGGRSSHRRISPSPHNYIRNQYRTRPFLPRSSSRERVPAAVGGGNDDDDQYNHHPRAAFPPPTAAYGDEGDSMNDVGDVGEESSSPALKNNNRNPHQQRSNNNTNINKDNNYHHHHHPDLMLLPPPSTSSSTSAAAAFNQHHSVGGNINNSNYNNRQQRSSLNQPINRPTDSATSLSNNNHIHNNQSSNINQYRTSQQQNNNSNNSLNNRKQSSSVNTKLMNQQQPVPGVILTSTSSKTAAAAVAAATSAAGTNSPSTGFTGINNSSNNNSNCSSSSNRWKDAFGTARLPTQSLNTPKGMIRVLPTKELVFETLTPDGRFVKRVFIFKLDGKIQTYQPVNRTTELSVDFFCPYNPQMARLEEYENVGKMPMKFDKQYNYVKNLVQRMASKVPKLIRYDVAWSAKGVLYENGNFEYIIRNELTIKSDGPQPVSTGIKADGSTVQLSPAEIDRFTQVRNWCKEMERDNDLKAQQHPPDLSPYPVIYGRKARNGDPSGATGITATTTTTVASPSSENKDHASGSGAPSNNKNIVNGGSSSFSSSIHNNNNRYHPISGGNYYYNNGGRQQQFPAVPSLSDTENRRPPLVGTVGLSGGGGTSSQPTTKRAGRSSTRHMRLLVSSNNNNNGGQMPPPGEASSDNNHANYYHQTIGSSSRQRRSASENNNNRQQHETNNNQYLHPNYLLTACSGSNNHRRRLPAPAMTTAAAVNN